MRLALDLASKGKGQTLSNPMVGCVIVYKNEIIGEGWHEEFGGLHAEPNAVNSVEDKSLIQEAEIYVTLEPCAHFGKTPPCADLISSLKPRRLIVCNVDPNPLVSGKGLRKIEDNGTEVITGVLEKEGYWLNRRFFTYHRNKRPYVILKWAETKDGFIARENYDSKWISSKASRTLVHQWRAEEDAIIVGTNTAIHDNPQLNVRMVEGRDPLRLFVDRQKRIPIDYRLFDGTQKTVCYTSDVEGDLSDNIEYQQIDFSRSISLQILTDLYRRNIQSIIIEGGSTLLKEFIDLNFWDEARIFTSSIKFEKGILSPKIEGELFKEEIIDTDELTVLLNK